jgi:hypothetical protein
MIIRKNMGMWQFCFAASPYSVIVLLLFFWHILIPFSNSMKNGIMATAYKTLFILVFTENSIYGKMLLQGKCCCRGNAAAGETS